MQSRSVVIGLMVIMAFFSALFFGPREVTQPLLLGAGKFTMAIEVALILAAAGLFLRFAPPVLVAWLRSPRLPSDSDQYDEHGSPVEPQSSPPPPRNSHVVTEHLILLCGCRVEATRDPMMTTIQTRRLEEKSLACANPLHVVGHVNTTGCEDGWQEPANSVLPQSNPPSLGRSGLGVFVESWPLRCGCRVEIYRNLTTDLMTLYFAKKGNRCANPEHLLGCTCPGPPARSVTKDQAVAGGVV